MFRFAVLIFLLGVSVFACAQSKPNILLIMADDMGYSDIGAYGGEIRTPHLDQLAKEGIRYRQFYNAARCCPTRASLLTGLYPHQAGMGWMAAADLGTGPAYQDNLNNECVTIAEVLKTAGYRTYMTGKWHVTNERKIDGEVIDNWPRQRGFDRYFGIIPGGANYFTPVLYSDNRKYKAPDDFYLTNAISDTSVRFLKDHFRSQKQDPFFMYVAYTAPHWPLHALKATIDKYKTEYKKGWDAVRAARFKKQKEIGLFVASAVSTPRDTAVPAWDQLTGQEKEEMSMRMAIYAAQIDIMDEGIGKIIETLSANNELDNTLIFFLSDNGACAEFISSGKSKAVDGTEATFESYRLPWANVSSTPFQQYKHFTHEGGIATPLIVHWPKGIAARLNNQFVSGYGHITDIMATCVAVSGAQYPSAFHGHNIHPMEGKSLLPHFSGQSNNRGRIYWEHEANIALRDGKWKLVAKTPEGEKFTMASLQLYDMDADPTEMKDLSRKEPERVKALYADWEQWARKIGAFPLDTREYGVRMQAYRRNINGDFDDNLGGWNIHRAEGMKGSIIVDENSRISGKKSAFISVSQPAARPAALSMLWPFKARQGEHFLLRMKTTANQNTRFFVRLESTGAGAPKVIDQELQIQPGVEGFEFTSAAIPENGMYRVGLYFGTAAPGSEVWIDDVELVAVKK
ncbi:arylsulfatase [Niabella drilacis]|uniref:Arylsulfatase n=1 Tax=Niabella drilacis (strain DSM 25811 / CCM 8410 / CCUG 62505 / LMG 26954 / E90) TaxID=1285928 RepID=A0A1G6ZQE3_NIADE|nr:arylsulfatase [Niabella drilacis]SDE04898.1 arylsulfatase [Niabella drilacis]